MLARGVAFEKQGDLAKALDCYTSAIEQSPKLAKAYYLRGGLYHGEATYCREQTNDDSALQLYRLAVVDYKMATKLDNKLGDAFLALGMLYARTGNFKSAIPEFSRVIELKPKNAKAYWMRGFTYFKLDNPDKAIADYTKCLHYDPKCTDALYGRGTLYIDKKLYDRAQADYKAVVQLDPSFEEVYFSIGGLCMRTHSYKNAAEAYRKYLSFRHTGTPDEAAYDLAMNNEARSTLAKLEKKGY